MKMGEIVRFICDEFRQTGGALQTLLYVPEVHSLDELERLRTSFPAALRACGAVAVVVYSADPAANGRTLEELPKIRKVKYQI